MLSSNQSPLREFEDRQERAFEALTKLGIFLDEAEATLNIPHIPLGGKPLLDISDVYPWRGSAQPTTLDQVEAFLQAGFAENLGLALSQIRENLDEFMHIFSKRLECDLSLELHLDRNKGLAQLILKTEAKDPDRYSHDTFLAEALSDGNDPNRSKTEESEFDLSAEKLSVPRFGSAESSVTPDTVTFDTEEEGQPGGYLNVS